MLTTDEAVGGPALIVRSDEPGRWIVSSSPIALVRVEIFRRGGLWFYVVVSEVLRGAVMVPDARGLRVDEESYFHEALRTAGDYVTRVARYYWMAHYTGRQRYAMGQQKCPHPMGHRCCDRTPVIGSVWCEWHRLGRR